MSCFSTIHELVSSAHPRTMLAIAKPEATANRRKNAEMPTAGCGLSTSTLQNIANNWYLATSGTDGRTAPDKARFPSSRIATRGNTERNQEIGELQI